MSNPKPIAILDTGAGGLSVARALRALAPREEIHYYADYANLPYGLKSIELIRYLAYNAANTLVKRSSCKILVIACHTISVCCDLAKMSAEFKVPVLGMMSPSIEGLARIVPEKDWRSFGIISTKATLDSGVYRQNWPMINKKSSCELAELASGPLVSLVEEGVRGEEELYLIISGLLTKTIKEADAVLLGCTHFSALTPIIKRVLRPDAEVIDAGELVAAEVLLKLEGQGDLSRAALGAIKAYVSDNPNRFNEVAKRFTDEPMSIELIRDRAIT
jgi:glutamate racemase